VQLKKIQLKANIVANYIGQIWSAVMQMACVPIYVNYLGIESYGLVGFYAIFQYAMILLDAGMTPVLNREMALYRAGTHSIKTMRDLLCTFQIVSCVVAVLIVAVLIAIAPWIASNWVKPVSLSSDSVALAISIMGIMAALRFLEGLYRGAILGFSDQVWLSYMTVIISTLRSVGGIAVLAYVSPTISAFFIWQVVISIISLLFLVTRVYKALPSPQYKGFFRFKVMAEKWTFMRGVLITSLLSILLSNADKVLLSKQVSLKEFGLYTLAGTLSGAIMLLANPLTQSFYPKLIEHAGSDRYLLSKYYHQLTKLIVMSVIPFALLMIFFGETIFFAWTGSHDHAVEVSAILVPLSIGTAILAIMTAPYYLQLSVGLTSFAAKINIVAFIIQLPLLLVFINRFGSLGAAWVWVALNIYYLSISVPIMHKFILEKELYRWYLDSLIKPVTIALVAVIILKVVIPDIDSRIYSTFILILILTILYSTIVLSEKDFRLYIRKEIKNIYAR